MRFNLACKSITFAWGAGARERMLHGWGRRWALGVRPGTGWARVGSGIGNGLGTGWERVGRGLGAGAVFGLRLDLGFCCFWPPVALDFYFLGSVGLGNAENAVQLDLGVEALRDCAGKREVGALFARRADRAKSNWSLFSASSVNWTSFLAERQLQLEGVFSSCPART